MKPLFLLFSFLFFFFLFFFLFDVFFLYKKIPSLFFLYINAASCICIKVVLKMFPPLSVLHGDVVS